MIKTFFNKFMLIYHNLSLLNSIQKRNKHLKYFLDAEKNVEMTESLQKKIDELCEENKLLTSEFKESKLARSKG